MNSKQKDILLFHRISMDYISLYGIQFFLFLTLVTIFGDFFYFWATELCMFVITFYRAIERWEKTRNKISDNEGP